MKFAITITVFLGMLCLSVLAFAQTSQPVRQDENQPSSMGVRIKRLSIDERRNVKAPSIVVYKTKYKKDTKVSFDHKTHAESFGLKCIECHHVEKCAHCHGSDTNSMMVEESKIALHETCMGCHRMMGAGPDKCDDCHKK